VPEVICDVSPIQYLHQAGLLELLRLRYGAVTIPTAVADELREGTLRGVDLPAFEGLDWIRIRQPAGRLLLPIVADLGAGEREVLALGTETLDSLVVLDDALARQYARMLKLQLTGTLGVLLKAKEAGLLPALAPVLERLQHLRFRIDPETRQAVLRLAGEA
jgi:predicted nucleic acid-binding protein